MTDLHRLSIRELSEGLKQAQFSSRELTEHYLKRIAKIDPQVRLQQCHPATNHRPGVATGRGGCGCPGNRGGVLLSWNWLFAAGRHSKSGLFPGSGLLPLHHHRCAVS